MYQMYIEKVLFPVTPGKLTIKVNGTNKTLTLINEGEVNLIKSPGLTDVSTEVLLPTLTEYPFATYTDGFQPPDYYLEKLEAWKQKRKAVTFKFLRTSPNGKKLLWDTSIPVTIEDYQSTEDAESEGFDVSVKISMKQYKEWGAKKLVKKKKLPNTKWRTAKDPAKTYTVKKGDTLIGIARKQLGNGSKHKSIYSLNKKTIEAAARKHGRKSSSNGHWIYPGTKLKLPRQSNIQVYCVKGRIW